MHIPNLPAGWQAITAPTTTCDHAEALPATLPATGRGTRLPVVAIVVAIAAGAAQSAHAQQHRVECPREAPAEWGLAKPAPLDQAAILSETTGRPIDDSAPPSLVPDRGFARGNVWHNIWTMGDEPGWSHYVDCKYRGSPRILRFRADGLKQCEQTARPYDARTGMANDASQTMGCD
jgi:hypothetical protein